MTTQSIRKQQSERADGRQRKPWLARLTLIVISTIILTNLAAAILVAAHQIYYDGLIYPGVSVWGVDLSGMTAEEAQVALQGQFNYPQTATITFRDSENIWRITAAELGVRFDVARSAQAAYEIGRTPGMLVSLQQQVAAWREGVVIAPVIVYDQTNAQVFLDQVAAQIYQEPRDASVQIEDFRAVSTAAQVGREVDTEATLALVGTMITSLESGEIDLVIHETEPTITDVSATTSAVNTILATELELYIADPLPDDPGPWIASREALADMLILERAPDEDTYTVELDITQFVSFLDPLAPQLATEPVNARLLFDDDNNQLVALTSSKDGRRLDVDATIQKVQDAIFSTEHRVALEFETIRPAVPDDALPEELGITELISESTTYFAGSSQSRRTNVAEAASRFNGVVIGPGEEFSFNEHLGDVSAETGFEESMIIYDGRTIKGVGGGVCQVSTTAFQAAFYSGFPILERYPHGYRVGYYEVGEGVGMDATVYSPLVDLRFLNDTDNFLLIETETDTANATVTFRFYSTSDGRTVQKDGPYISNEVPPGPPIYEENDELSPGQVKQVDWAHDGSDVRINRTVYRNGTILHQDTFVSQYVPWQAVYQVAPGYKPANSG